MRSFLMGVLLFLLAASPVQAGGDLTAAVNSRWIPRAVGETLHDIARQRVIEISRCSTCLNHNLQRPGTAEVLGWNSGYTDPIAQIIRAWANSPIHNAILSDRDLERIGCAHRFLHGKHWFACVLR